MEYVAAIVHNVNFTCFTRFYPETSYGFFFLEHCYYYLLQKTFSSAQMRIEKEHLLQPFSNYACTCVRNYYHYERILNFEIAKIWKYYGICMNKMISMSNLTTNIRCMCCVEILLTLLTQRTFFIFTIFFIDSSVHQTSCKTREEKIVRRLK